MPKQSAPRTASWGRCWLEGAGAAILLSPSYIWTQLSRTNIDTYHRLLPLTTVDRSLAIELVLLSLIGMVVVRFLDRRARFAELSSIHNRRPVLLLWALWFGILAPPFRTVANLALANVMWWQRVSAREAFLWTAVLLFLLWLLSRRWFLGAVRVLRVAVLLLGFCIFWMVPGLLRDSMAHQPRDQASFLKPLPTPVAPHQRIVWVLFDEMSYDQVFVRRFPGLALPNLDELRSQSTTFSDVNPDGRFTEDVIPSILLGTPIDQVRGTPSGWMIYQAEKNGPWLRFQGSQTLFANAQRDGWTTGVVGDFNPYCRVLRDQLDSCWMSLPPLPNGMSRDKSTLGNLFAPLTGAWDRQFHRRASRPAPSGTQTVDSLPGVAAGDALIRDPRIDLCLVHLPLPHPPGDYNRKTGRIGPGGTYIDNLALSDRILGHILAEIAQSPDADRTVLVLSSDHSWRTWLWRGRFDWTTEEELASRHGQFDPRPMLMVRFPGQTKADTVSQPVPLLSMHNLLERIMSGEVESAQELEAWAAKQ